MSGMILTTRAFVSRNNSFQRTPVRGEAVTSSGRCHKAVSRVEAVTDGDRRFSTRRNGPLGGRVEAPSQPHDGWPKPDFLHAVPAFDLEIDVHQPFTDLFR